LSKHTKIAIVGIACRFPGNIESLDDYWQVLKNGQDVVTQIPDTRWSKAVYGHPKRKIPGRSYIWSAGVLSQVDQFEAEFFGISRREAEQMDPQQRLLLELTWEAFEDGGLHPNKIAGSNCGVFIGIGSNDYMQRKIDDLDSTDAYSMTGVTASIGSNRISYIFDLRGPSMSVDTACSSSLVALHQACNSISMGEASMAVAGGVNMLLHPLGFVGFSKASMLSPTGRCKAFDASGDGYVRAEGAAIVVLKSLAQAEADGDQIYAVITASGVNCDGKTNGITVPSSQAQAALLNSIYSHSEFDINDIVYVEAHGTGTAVGDPLETKALSVALGAQRAKDNPLLIGSAKTNLGHLEVASGMAGLLKAVLCLKYHAIPKSLHFKTPNPAIHFQEWNLKVADSFTPLPDTQKPLFVGVNSFGFGGANAHVLLEEYLTDKNLAANYANRIPPLFFSARKTEALVELAIRYAQLITAADAAHYYDIAWSALHHRQLLEHRVAIFADDKATLLKNLHSFIQGEPVAGVVSAEAMPESTQLAFVYSGNGCQWLGMGCVLFKENKVFRNTVKEVDKYWQQYADFSIVEELFANKDSDRMQLTEVAQPVLFAFQVALTKMLQALGLNAVAALGHSVGEVAAAWASGALSLRQAVHVVYERSFAQAQTQGLGKMAAVGLSAPQMQEKLTTLKLADKVVVAGINSPNSVTISGDESALKEIEAQMLASSVFFRLLDLDYAFHSPYMNPIQERVLKGLEKLKPSKTRQIRFISTVTGKELTGNSLNANYWWENIRHPVEFNAAVNTLIAEGVTLFVEIGAHPVLCRYIEQCLQTSETAGKAIATIKRQEESVNAVNAALYKAYLSGAAIDQSIAFPVTGRFVKLPAYPWQREHYWHEQTENGYGLIERWIENPLLGYRLKDAQAAWENALDTVLMPWLADHEVGGAVVLPAAAYIEMALAASKAWLKGSCFEIEELDISAPIVLDAEHLKTVIFKVATTEGTFAIRSRDYIGNNVTGRLLGTPMQKSTRLVSIVPALIDAPKRLTASQHYQLTKAVGLNYGAAFQGIDSIWLWPQQKIVWARLTLPATVQAEVDRYLLHPSLLDSCFQCLVDIFSEQIDSGQRQAMIPVRVGKLRFYGDYGQPKWCKVEMKHYSRRSVIADFIVLDADYNTVAVLTQVRFRSVNFIKGAEHYPASYVYATKLMPHVEPLTPAPLPSFKSLGSSVMQSLKAQESRLKREQHFNEVLPLFDVLVTAYCFEAVNTLMAGQSSCTVSQLVTCNAIVDQQIDLLLKLLAIVKEDRLVSYQGDKWALLKNTEMPESGAIWRTILADYPEYLPELVLMAQCGANLVNVLCGKIEPNALLSPQKSSIKEHLYGYSRSFGVANLIATHVLKQCVKQWPDNRRLRVLEITTGQTELTQSLLHVLPPEICDYVMIVADEDAVAHAQAIFETLDFFTPLWLDIENLPESLPEQLKLGYFDIVIAANVLHKSSNLAKTLANVRQFLVSEGMLLLQERASDRFTDITCGLEPKWWLYDEETGAACAHLLTTDAWIRLLEGQQFVETKLIVEPEASPDNQGVFVILAKNSRLVAPLAEQNLPQTWLLLLDESKSSQLLSKQLAAALEAKGQHVIALQTGADLTGFKNLSGLDYDHIVHLYGWNMPEQALELKLAEQRCLLAMTILQNFEPSTSSKHPTLWLITSGGAVYQPNELAESEHQPLHYPAQAALWGLGRVAMNEYPNLNIRLVDLPVTQAIGDTVKLLVTEFLSTDDETEVVVTPTARHVLRMQRTVLKPRRQELEKKTPAVALDFKMAGSLNNLYWRLLEPAPTLAPDQIQIRPCAAGLNFRDVMYAMGMLSDEAVENGFAGATLGMELSGVVERVGKNVKTFKPGDEVISFAPASFSTRVITETTATALKPKNWSHEQATTVPTTFFTVYYALHHLARLQPGEKILIHGAAGGVGLAAIQYAEYVGAEIFATAGSPEKRAFVKMMGADHVMDSRSMAFADEVMALTDGKGVDVVLNSLSGEAIWRNLSILRPFGRFLELGKRDFYENSKIGLRPFRNNISYYGIDADQLLIERKTLAAELFKEMMKLFTDHVLRPLPFRVFPAAQIIDAFRYMQQSRHIGKVVISFNEPETLVAQTEQPLSATLKLDAHASYLVSGGLGGFGLKTAQWLVEKGAKHLILIGRSGVSSAQAAQAVQEMEATGVTVYARAVDVCDAEQLSDLFTQMAYCAPPLKGVIHAAAIIEDSLISQLDPQQFSRVLKPKVQGSWLLHQLTEKLDLDFFVLYSSMTTFLGNPGQTNYVAANSYLESLAHYRRSKGLAGLYAAWGPIEDVGFLTRNQTVKETLESRIGSKAINSAMALQMLEKLLLADTAGAAVIDFDWAAISRFMPSAKSPKYEQQLLQLKRLGGSDHSHENIKSLLTSLSSEEALNLIAQLLAQEVGQILRLPAEKVDKQKSVFDLGMDSLMGMELAIAIEARFEVKLPLMTLAEGATISKLAVRIVELLQTDSSVSLSDAPQETVRALASRHEEALSEEMINKLVDSIKTTAQGGSHD
jgi:acyl transferase domain-containing protein/acyl carrier protein